MVASPECQSGLGVSEPFGFIIPFLFALDWRSRASQSIFCGGELLTFFSFLPQILECIFFLLVFFPTFSFFIDRFAHSFSLVSPPWLVFTAVSPF